MSRAIPRQRGNHRALSNIVKVLKLRPRGPIGAHFPEIIGQNERRSGTIGTVNDGDRLRRQFGFRVQLLAQFRTPWRLRRVLEALRDAPESRSERILAELARRDARFIAE